MGFDAAVWPNVRIRASDALGLHVRSTRDGKFRVWPARPSRAADEQENRRYHYHIPTYLLHCHSILLPVIWRILHSLS